MTDLKYHLAGVLRESHDQAIALWATENLRYPKGRSALGDRPTWDAAPFWIEVLEAAKRPTVRQIVLQTSVQLGKTTALECLMGWAGSVKGWNSMLVTPSDVLHKELKNRVSTTLKESAIGIIDERGKGSAGNKLTYHAGNELNFVMGSNESNIVSIPTDLGAMDELDELEDAGKIQKAVELLENRGAARPRFIAVLASTPKLLEKQGGICDLYNSTKRYELHMQCPHCKERFYPHFDLLGYPDDTDPAEIEEKGLAWMTCPHSGCIIEESHHKAMAMTAAWACKDPAKASVKIGFKANIFFNLRRGWSAVAAKYLDVKDDQDKLWNFWNSWMAEPRAESKAAEAEFESKSSQSLYRRTQVPADVEYITFGMDVGKDMVWAVALGWGAEGRMYKIEAWRMDFAGREGFGRIAHEVNKIFSGDRWEFLGLTRPVILIGGIDSNYYKPEVFDLCYQDRRIFPLSGNSRAREPYKWFEADPEKKHGNKFYGLNVLEISHDYSQSKLEFAIRQSHGRAGAIHFPSDCWRQYLDHLCNERESERLVAGRLRKIWQPISRMVRHDFRDCTRYAMMAGIIKGLNKIKAKAPATPANDRIKQLGKLLNKQCVKQLNTEYNQTSNNTTNDRLNNLRKMMDLNKNSPKRDLNRSRL